MIKKGVSRRYAKALYALAAERELTTRVEKELATLRDYLRDNSKVREILEHPLVNKNQKKDILAEYGQKFVPELKHFLFLLVDKERLEHIFQIGEEFQELINEERGIQVAEITTAYPLSEQHREALKKALAQVMGKDIMLKEEVKEEMIGGIVTRIGTMVLDASINASLADVYSKLAGSH